MIFVIREVLELVIINKILHKDPHIYLLSPAAFENQAPNYQIKKLLDKELANKRVKVESPSKKSASSYRHESKVSYSNANSVFEDNFGTSVAMSELKNDLRPLQARLEEARNLDEIHLKNIQDMQKIKAEIGARRGKKKREKRNTGYLNSMQKQSEQRPTTQNETKRSETAMSIQPPTAVLKVDTKR